MLIQESKYQVIFECVKISFTPTRKKEDNDQYTEVNFSEFFFYFYREVILFSFFFFVYIWLAKYRTIYTPYELFSLHPSQTGTWLFHFSIKDHQQIFNKLITRWISVGTQDVVVIASDFLLFWLRADRRLGRNSSLLVKIVVLPSCWYHKLTYW